MMSRYTKQIANKAPQLLKATTDYAKPRLETFRKYALVELTPPMPGDIPQIVRGIGNLIYSASTAKWRHLTVREAWLNTLVATEVACWFFVGECIGKRHIVGYKLF